MAKTLVYEMWPISWPGGLKQMQKHLDIIEKLHVDYVWLAPLYPSPRYDHGYDIADYRAIDSRFGTMEDFDDFINVAHAKGVKVLMDLVLNHVSIYHPWFVNYPKFFYHNNRALPGWTNLFDGGPAWEYDHMHGGYYLHLFCKEQADLAWFMPPSELRDGMTNGITDEPNRDLVRMFQGIVNFWVNEHGIDGFRLDVPQSMNKDFSLRNPTFGDYLFGDRAIEVINAIFAGDGAIETRAHEPLFLMMECFDPTNGKIIQKYVENTPVNYVLNVLLKEQKNLGDSAFTKALDQLVKTTGFMLDLESHDSPRFRFGCTDDKDITDVLFQPDVEAVCLYQGQELNHSNPDKLALPDWMMVALDARTRLYFQSGTPLDQLRPKSRANARVPIRTSLYDSDPDFPIFIEAIERWKGLA